MSIPTSILIIGAGELGTAILTALLSHPARQPGATQISLLRRPATLITPTPETNRLLSLGITLEPGDFVNNPIPQLAATFSKYHTVIQASGFGLSPGTQSRVTSAVLQAGVERYFPWQFGLDYQAIGKGSDQNLFDEMLSVRETLAAQDKTSWTVVSTGLFMSFLLFEKAFGVVDFEGRKVTALGGWDNNVTVTAVEDIGRVVAELVYVPGGSEDKVAFVAGETVSYREVAEILERVVGGNWEKKVLDGEGVKEEVRSNPEDGMIKYRSVFSAGRGTAWDVARTVNYERGMKMVGLEEYLKRGRKG